MTKIEQAARAIFAARYGSRYEPMPWVADAARASITGMRTPSEAMLIAARDWSHAKYGKPIGDDAATGCWRAMIDAALAEKP